MFRTLIDVPTLAAHLDTPAWVICDCRFRLSDPAAGRRAYDKAHIPGARYVDLNRDLAGPVTPNTGRHPLPDPHALAHTLGALGIGAGVQVVAYDDAFGSMAARLWWLLRWLGHDAVAVLDGGLQAWTRANRPLTDAVPTPQPETFNPKPTRAMMVDAASVEQALAARSHRLIDVRAEERFRGEVEPFDKVAGHIPGAINIPYEDNLAPSGCFLSPAELRAQYADIDPAGTIAMCGSGVTACHTLLAFEHAGLVGAKLYPGSWSEWIVDPRRPVARDGA